jgi:hypothetical protein
MMGITLNNIKNICNGTVCAVLVCATIGCKTATPAQDNRDNRTHIHHIQGAGHVSPMNGKLVANVEGIVTAVRNNGFWMQDPQPDNLTATSEGIFVFTHATPSPKIGDRVVITGTVTEFRPGPTASRDAYLSITQIVTPNLDITILANNQPLPAPVIIGTGGRMPPQKVIDDDANGSAEMTGTFDADTDGLDFYESLEGMLVQVNDAVVVGPSRQFSSGTPNREVYIIGENGANATMRTARGGILIAKDDYNPERMVVTNLLNPVPDLVVGDQFVSPIVGVFDYNFGKYQIHPTQRLQVRTNALVREVTTPAHASQLAIGCFNVENLHPNNATDKFERIAKIIVTNLQSPDLLTLQEVQDNDGPNDTEVVDASITLNTLVAAVQKMGGPRYEWREISPQRKQDGGVPGGNIRVAFFFRTDRGLSFVDRPGGNATRSVNVVRNSGGKPELNYSPARIEPGNAAFKDSRKPLIGEFRYKGKSLFVVGNHFMSKGGDQPLYGVNQPPILTTEPARTQQALAVKHIVQEILNIDSNANVVVLGDLNDFEFSKPIRMLMGRDDKAPILHTLVETLPPEERYTYVYEGNAETLDHILISDNLLKNAAPQYDIVHVNAEFVDRASDHDPSVAKFTVQ